MLAHRCFLLSSRNWRQKSRGRQLLILRLQDLSRFLV
jgi:hypothetical protein